MKSHLGSNIGTGRARNPGRLCILRRKPANNREQRLTGTLKLAINDRFYVWIIHGAVDKQQHEHDPAECYEKAGHRKYLSGYQSRVAQMAYIESSTAFLSRTVLHAQSHNQSPHVGTGPISLSTNVPRLL